MATEDIKRLNSISAAVVGIADVTPSDATDLANSFGDYPTNILLAEALEVTIRDRFDNDITFEAGALAAGVFHRISVQRVMATNTDAGLTAGRVKVGWDG